MMQWKSLPIFIENPKGSYRYWYDSFNNERGASYMYYAYGYIKNTLGTDGDEVDVYIGPVKDSQRVFIVTQTKTPDFIELDEQKVFLGFDTREQVEEAYLHQYNDPRFLGDILEMDLYEFVYKLSTQRGQFIKSLNKYSRSAKMKSILKSISSTLEDLDKEEIISKPFQSEAQRRKFYAMEKEGEVSSEEVDEWESHTKNKDLPEKKAVSKHRKKAVDLLKSVSRDVSHISETRKESEPEVSKALTSVSVNPMASRARLHAYYADSAKDQPSVGTRRERDPNEPPVVPVRSIGETPAMCEPQKYEVIKSCRVCSTIHKSTVECPKCHKNKMITEARPFRFRG